MSQVSQLGELRDVGVAHRRRSVKLSESAGVDRRARRMASTRQDLLMAGRRLFSVKGLYESRVDEITDSADVGKGTLYRYFASKEALILAVVDAGFEELQVRIAARLVNAEGLRDTVDRIVESHVAFYAANPDLMRIFHQARGMLKFDRREWRPLRASLQRHLAFLAGELGRFEGGAAGSPSRRRERAALLFGAVSGIVSVRVASDPRADIASMGPSLRGAVRGLMRLSDLDGPAPVRGRRGARSLA